MSVPNWRAQRACISLQARVASLAGMSTPSTSAAVFFVTPEKSREPAPPHRTNVRPMAPRRTHASHCWPCRPSRIRCSIPCPKKTTLKRLAERTGLEPATPGVTGRYSNQLNYRSNFLLGVEGFRPSTLARSGRSLRRAEPGRRQKGAEFSRESELCRFDDSSDFLRQESVRRGVPVRIDGRSVHGAESGGKMAPEHRVTVDYAEPALRRE